MTTVQDKSTYSQNEISGINNNLQITIENASNNNNNNNNDNNSNTSNNVKQKDTTVGKTALPKTGENETILCLIAVFTILTIYIGYKLIKFKISY